MNLRLLTEASAGETLALVLRISCLPILVSAIELIACPDLLSDEGLLSWEVGRLRHPLLAVGWTGRLFDAVMNHRRFVALLWPRALLAGLLLVSPNRWLLAPGIDALMVLLLFLFAKRSMYGQDGADQMQLIIWITALIATAIGGQKALALGIWFLAYQTCMSYCVAGFAKIRAPGWRKGEFLPGVLGTVIYGTRFFGGFLRRNSRVALVLSWAVLLFETSFPLAWILPWPWGAGYLAVGLIFHVANAFLMGLGTFLATFLAAYPAVLFTLQRKGW
jgi:hypothetical protein